MKLKKILVSLIFFIAVWEAIGRSNVYPAYLFPPFSRVASSFMDPEYLYIVLDNLWLTLVRATFGFVIGTITGILLGLFFVGLRLSDYVQPIATIFFVIPSVAWIPLLILWVGLDSFKLPITATFMCSFPPILYGMINASRTIDQDQVEVAFTLGASPWEVLRRIVLPVSLLKLFPIIKTEIIMVWKTTIVVEMVALSSGLGHLLLMYSLVIDVRHVLSTIMVFSLVMISIIELVDSLEKKVVTNWLGEHGGKSFA